MSESEPDFKLLYEQKLSENDLLKKEVEILNDHLKNILHQLVVKNITSIIRMKYSKDKKNIIKHI